MRLSAAWWGGGGSQVSEYVYWSIASLLGMHTNAGAWMWQGNGRSGAACSTAVEEQNGDVCEEWKAFTPSLMRELHPEMVNLIEGDDLSSMVLYSASAVAPNGVYDTPSGQVTELTVCVTGSGFDPNAPTSTATPTPRPPSDPPTSPADPTAASTPPATPPTIAPTATPTPTAPTAVPSISSPSAAPTGGPANSAAPTQSAHADSAAPTQSATAVAAVDVSPVSAAGHLSVGAVAVAVLLALSLFH